ncbi:MAG TPA: 2-oxo acid dehydrogenase subunit E2, partial [Kribbellaceae bacterium]
MATEPSPTDPAQSNPLSAFGANDWLVDEMYEKYVQDPNSVDKAWWEFFKGYTPGKPPFDDGRVDDGRVVAQQPVVQPPAAQATAQPQAAAAQAQPAAGQASYRRATPEATASPTAQTPAVTTTPAAQAQTVQQAPAAKSDGTTPSGGTVNQPPRAKPKVAPETSGDAETMILRGAPARTAQNMETSLTVPTATSVRQVPVKLLIDNRIVINNHLKRARGGKVSFTHLVGWALVRALKSMPEMNASYTETDGKPTLVKPAHINLGLAIDMKKPDGTRQLLVPSIKAAETMNFAEFWMAYEDIVRRARDNKLALPDFQGTTLSLTNPGTIGTQHSVPRLMQGQGVIIGVGAMEYPPEYQGAADETMAKLAVSKVMTLTSTYDHRIIQGAQSG